MFGQRGRLNARLIGLAVAFAIAGMALTARVVYVQLVHAGHYQDEARDEHFGQQVVRAPRGAILDRNGFPLATTVDAYDVYISRPDWKDNGAALRAAAAIAPAVKRDVGELITEVRKDNSGLYLAYTGLEFEQGKALKEADAPGVRLVQTTKRYYPEVDVASNLLGFVGRDHTGLA